ncbi:MFS transporter [Candidatus Cytomitobacter primus]|uniref:AmpG family muropeptide MFS transporter n=1 Tax=Candidatus Cytomitobacter primus TaxID=2066024 RepID=A0A5C0UF87_9PROT|nr:AmpG family muropeptide MFS transporter [Candidatus Cytomitobacter primus]QEK38351.1 AmpG family muropeptide MFS transporter [Candidatus Cytomitobacter primus]
MLDNNYNLKIRNNVVLALGLVSAAIYALCSHTLIYWLSDLDIPTKALGFVSLIYIIQALKIFWIPVFEKFNVPLLNKFLDRRASWIFLCILVSGSLILYISFLHPLRNMYVFATCIAIATFGMSIMDTLLRAQIMKLAIDNDKDQTTIMGLGAFGFRIGMYICINIYFLLSLCIAWKYIYRVSGVLIILSSLLLFILPKVTELSKEKSLKELLIVPYQSFLKKNKKYIWSIVGFMVFFRLQDKLLAPTFYKFISGLKPASSLPFISQLGIKPIFSFYKFISGPIMAFSVYYSIKFLKKHSYKSNAFISVLVHSLTCLPLLILNMQKTHIPLFILFTLLLEKLVRGFSSNVYYLYQSKFCEKEHAAGQIAMLSFLEAMSGAIFGLSSGYIVAYFSWTALFILGTFISLPVLFFIKKLPNDL